MWKVVAQTSAVRIYGLVVAIIFLSLTARWLGPEGRGQLAAVLTWVGLFSTIGYLSLGQVAIRNASISEDKSWINEAFGALSFWTLATTVIGIVLAYYLYQLTNGGIYGLLPASLLLIGIVLLPILIWENHISSLLMALERLDIYNRYQVIGKSAGLISLPLLVLFIGLGVEGAIIATILGQSILVLGGLFLLVRIAGRPNLFNFSVNLEYLKKGLTLHMNAIGVYIYTASDVLMLNYYHGAELTGYYQLGIQLLSVILVIPQSVSMVIYGKVASDGVNAAWNYQKKILIKIILLTVIIAFIAGITVEWWLIMLAGNAFIPAIDVFRWQLLSVVGMSLSILMAAQWVGRGYFWQSSLITVCVAFSNIVANKLLIPEYGMYGAIWASLGVYLVSIIANGLMIIHCNNEIKRIKA